METLAVCSAKPRPSVQRTGKGGAQWWRRDVYHLTTTRLKTLCGRDCSEWILIGPVTIDHNCCARCAAKATNPTLAA